MSVSAADREIFQYYWRCEHHPSAIENFFWQRAACEWCCHTQDLRWFDNGMSPPPKSWGDGLAQYSVMRQKIGA